MIRRRVAFPFIEGDRTVCTSSYILACDRRELNRFYRSSGWTSTSLLDVRPGGTVQRSADDDLEAVSGPGDRRYRPARRRRRPPSSAASDTRSGGKPEPEQAFGPGPRARWSRSGPWRSRRRCFAEESDGGRVRDLQRAELVGDGNEPGDPARHER